MDKKNTVIGVLLLVAAFGAFYWSSKNAPRPQPRPVETTAPQETVTAPATGTTETGPVGPTTPIVPGAASTTPRGQPLYAEAQTSVDGDSIITLGNE